MEPAAAPADVHWEPGSVAAITFNQTCTAFKLCPLIKETTGHTDPVGDQSYAQDHGPDIATAVPPTSRPIPPTPIPARMPERVPAAAKRPAADRASNARWPYPAALLARSVPENSNWGECCAVLPPAVPETSGSRNQRVAAEGFRQCRAGQRGRTGCSYSGHEGSRKPKSPSLTCKS